MAARLFSLWGFPPPDSGSNKQALSAQCSACVPFRLPIHVSLNTCLPFEAGEYEGLRRAGPSPPAHGGYLRSAPAPHVLHPSSPIDRLLRGAGFVAARGCRRF